MNYKCYCHSSIECTIEKTSEEEGEYYDDNGETYYVHTSFNEAKKMLIELIAEQMKEWIEVKRLAKKLTLKNIEYYE